MNRRDEQIAAIKNKSDRLDPVRLGECYEHVLRGYESETSIESIARGTPAPDRTPSAFRVLTNSEARRIDHFNDSSYNWDLYCEQLGRSIAWAEMRYIFEELQKIEPEGEPLNSIQPSFGGLAEAVALLRSKGYQPDTLCAPPAVMARMDKDTSVIIDWNVSPREVVILDGGVRLNLFWSGGIAPLDRLVVLDSSRMNWQVKPDPESGGRLTVAIGQSRIATGEEGVVFLAETVAQFELDVDAVVTVGIDGDLLKPEEYVVAEQPEGELPQ